MFTMKLVDLLLLLQRRKRLQCNLFVSTLHFIDVEKLYSSQVYKMSKADLAVDIAVW
jgi:hypothetical protein